MQYACIYSYKYIQADSCEWIIFSQSFQVAQELKDKEKIRDSPLNRSEYIKDFVSFVYRVERKNCDQRSRDSAWKYREPIEFTVERVQ